MTAADRWAPQVEQYSICGLPEGHELCWEFTVFVTRSDEPGLWTVKSRVYQLDAAGEPEVIPREWDWTPYLMPLDRAFGVARARAQAVTLRGKTAMQWLRDGPTEQGEGNAEEEVQ